MIQRSQLESWTSLEEARTLVNGFFKDRDTYPDDDFYSRRRGINKDIPEEFYPLVLLAEHLEARAVRLSPDSLAGPDGVLRLEDESELKVQVTLSHERAGGHQVRLALRDRGSYTSKVKDISRVIAERASRILDALQEKEDRFHAGTDVLLIVDKSISWGDVIDPGLPAALKAALGSLPVSRYSATYIAFGTDIRLLR